MQSDSKQKLIFGLLIGHLVALVFGIIGLLIMLPNPDLWADDPNAVKVFDWSMKYAGSVHIIFGALVIFAFGVYAVGWKKTVIFAVVSGGLSLASELIGTGTGWPFGNYEYTDFLGWKVMDRVPYTIPMSWFYMGFASYLMGAVIVKRMGWSRVGLWTCLLGAFFLTVWDLVLDPAMAHESLRIKFWEWDDTGAYFGMPVKNLIGWSVTGLIFMVASRLVWREDIDIERLPFVPMVVYVANLIFAMAIAASVDLWIPILLAIILGIVPAIAVWREDSRIFPAKRQLAADV